MRRKRPVRRAGDYAQYTTLDLKAAVSCREDGRSFDRHWRVLEAFEDCLGDTFYEDLQREPPADPPSATCMKGRCRTYLCRYHLAIEQLPNGSLRLAFPRKHVDELQYECLHKFVEAHPDGASLDQIGNALGVTRQRCLQMLRQAMGKLRPAAIALQSAPKPSNQ
jgi:hypothetical protein